MFTYHAKEKVGAWRAATAAKPETPSSSCSYYRWMAAPTDRRNRLAGISKTTSTSTSFSIFVFQHQGSVFIQMQRGNASDRWHGVWFLKVIECKAKHLPQFLWVTGLWQETGQICTTNVFGARCGTANVQHVHMSLWDPKHAIFIYLASLLTWREVQNLFPLSKHNLMIHLVCLAS